MGATGKIHIHDATTQAVVATIDVQSPLGTKTIGGLDNYNYHTVLIADSEVTLVPKPGALAYGRSYYVTIDAGAFKSGADAFGGLDQSTAWRFTTKPAAPAAGAKRLTVAADGTGDFCTVQGALDAIPDGSTRPSRSSCARAPTARSSFSPTSTASRSSAKTAARRSSPTHNAKFNASGGNPFAGRVPNPSGENPRQGGNIYRRGMFLAHRVKRFHARESYTPQHHAPGRLAG